MPIYHFRNKETDDIIEAEMRMSELDTFKADNPHLKQVILSAPYIQNRLAHRHKPCQSVWLVNTKDGVKYCLRLVNRIRIHKWLTIFIKIKVLPVLKLNR